MDNMICPVCERNIQSHAHKIQCSLCKSHYHLNCITLARDEQLYVQNNSNIWYCSTCIESIFPFNTIENDQEFIVTASLNDISGILYNNDLLFNPFETYNDHHNHPLDDVDPDINMYNEMNLHIGHRCMYFLENSFNEQLTIQKENCNAKNAFSLFHLNIRSMKQNLPQLNAYLDAVGFPFTIIGLSETWLQNHNCTLYGLNGYSLIENHRENKTGGGVGILLKDSVSYIRRSDLDHFDDIYESIFIELDHDQLGVSKNVVIGVVYRPPGTDITVFNESFNILLGDIQRENRLCYILGDYNINLLNNESHVQTSDFIEVLYSNSFIPLVTRPTRISTRSASLIDNIFTNNFHNLQESLQGIFVTDISDHYPIFHINYEIQHREYDICFWKRVKGLKNKLAFQQSLTEIDWGRILSNTDTQNAFSEYYSIILSLFHEHFPKIKVKMKYNTRKPCLTEALRSSIKTKNKLYSKFKKCNSAHNEHVYKTYRNKLNHILSHAEKKHYADLLEKSKNNVAKTWKILKTIINRNKARIIQSKFRLNNGYYVTDKHTISSKFNDFFVGIGPTLAKNIDKQDISPSHYLGDKLPNTIFLKPVSQDEIVKLVKSLKNTAPGHDDMTADILKLSLNHTVDALVHLCNLSLLQGVFPSELKMANVLPLYKASDSMSFNNYRPVSLLSTLSKVFEKIMYNRLLDFLEKHDILFKYQFGFRKKHSAYMALMVLTDKIIKCMENGESVIGIFLDFSKAFDTVDHGILLTKLYHYGIRGNALDWFSSYLSDRQQYVTYNGVSSSPKSITCGVPQGSILGPLLFLIYINDLAKICTHTFCIMFADDSNMFHSGTNIEQMQNILNTELAKISKWLKVNKLSLNIDKTHFMLFKGHRHKDYNIEIYIDGKRISEVNQSKFLGVLIDNKLKWNHHISLIASKISRGIGLMIKARNFLNKSTLTNLYYSFIYPYFIYCNHIWGSAYATHLKKLIVLQKKVVRIICRKNPRSHTDPLFREMGILKLTDINKYLLGKFLFRWYHEEIPSIFRDMFTMKSDIHMYDTRGRLLHLHVPVIKSNLGKQNVRYRGTLVWNSIIRNGISPLASDYVFSKSLKKLLILSEV